MQMKKLLILAAAFLFTTVAIAQTKFDFYLAEKQQAFAQKLTDGSEMIEVLVKGNVKAIKQLVQANNGVFKYSYGNIAAIKIPVSSLPAFYYSRDVVRMEGKPPHMHPCNDTMRTKAHVVECQMGQAPLTQPYKGKGIVIGMIDTGIDFTHPDLQDSAHKSRVQYLWDMNQPIGPLTPTPYGYGVSWSKAMIDTALAKGNPATLKTMDSAAGLESGHGSHVSGVATSDGLANGTCIGVAPQADIMMVAYNFTVQTNNEMTDAVNYLYTKADSLGEPCVINASLGDYDGSHDGQDLQALMIDSMITAKAGRVFVASAGNASNIPYHVGYTQTAGDTSFSWFAYTPANGGTVYFDAWADTATAKNLQFSVGVDNIKPFTFISQTAFSAISANLGKIIYDTLKNSHGNRIGIVETYTYTQGKAYSVSVQIKPDSTSYYWRFTTTGNGRVDCWYPDPTPIVDTGLPNVSVFPAIKNYKMPDTLSTLCSSYQCSNNVITVGVFHNRNTFRNYDSTLTALYDSTVIEGSLSYYSGVGPTRDGRMKPDITAPGDFCMSVIPTVFQNYLITTTPTHTDYGGWHYYDGGTSTASPAVAGVAALYLQRFPTSTNLQVKEAITYCSDQDTFTGVTPNYQWGYGKVDAFKALTGCELAVNNIPSVPTSSLFAYPNPTNGGTTIGYDFSTMNEYCTATIDVYDVFGKKIKTLELKNNKGTVQLNSGELSSGMYFYTLMVDGQRLKTEKLIVEK